MAGFDTILHPESVHSPYEQSINKLQEPVWQVLHRKAFFLITFALAIVPKKATLVGGGRSGWRRRNTNKFNWPHRHTTLLPKETTDKSYTFRGGVSYSFTYILPQADHLLRFKHIIFLRGFSMQINDMQELKSMLLDF